MIETKITQKYQTTVPKKIRKYLGIKPGEEVEWYIVKGLVIVDVSRKLKHPVAFLTSQIKLDLDAVELVKEAREDFR